MAEKTGIEWTDTTWNPTRGCTRVSPGCQHCYAEVVAAGVARKAYAGLTKRVGGEPRWTGEVRVVPEMVGEPLHWRKPRRVFVNSMSDLFHESIPFEFIDSVFAVMALCPQHTFQVLTKRPERMRNYLWEMQEHYHGRRDGYMERWVDAAAPYVNSPCYPAAIEDCGWPIPNVWLGVSVENQECADERIPHLLETPAAVKFLSCEPLLGPIDFRKVPGFNRVNLNLRNWWAIVGCESRGKKAGRFADEYESAARSILRQCGIAGVPGFHKQMPIDGRVSGDPEDWPEDLRVREFPNPIRHTPDQLTFA